MTMLPPSQEETTAEAGSFSDADVAIVGIAGRFPGAPDVATFWQNLVNGVEARTYLSDDDLRRLVESQDELDAPFKAKDIKDPNYVRALPLLDDVELFDAGFFGYNPREAELIDPQQRLFLEVAWHALEDAGYDPHRYRGLIGVYAGAHESAYSGVLHTYREMMHSERGFIAGLGNQNDYLPTRTSYKLNLRGPSIEVQTACSTSLVAIHLARQSLLNGECDMALAGGALVNVPQREGYVYDGGGMVSPEGRCRTFDARAGGTVFSGGGIGVVVLKRLESALEDGDQIYAVIKGSAVGNDGGVKAGFTAPSVSGQAQTIAEALAVADVNPDTISYVEAHGTGTPLGDPIEVAALTQVYRNYTQRKGYCALGTAKTNVGHLGAVAGVTGVIKTALSLKHRLLPGILHFETPNPKIDFANSPFFVNDRLRVWESPDGLPRRAGVSAFGVGGTNAHAVLEEAPQARSTPSTRPFQLLLLSARTPTALEAMTTNLAAHLQATPDLDLADVAYTLQVGRHGFQQRRFLVCRDIQEATAALSDGAPAASGILSADGRTRGVAFMFSGQGSQYVEMGRDLYAHEPTFRSVVDRCAELLQPHLDCDLRDLLYPTADSRVEAQQQLTQTAFTQPALFVIEYATAQMLLAWGLEPRAMIGHSVGEYVAACLAGVFSLEDGLALIAERGRLMQGLPAGAMLSVALSATDTAPYLNSEIALAASNGPTATVVAGPIAAIDALEARLTAEAIACRRLHTSHAFHSAMMEPILEAFTQRVAQVSLHPPARPYVSNVSGTWITAAEATDPAYWARHLRQAVRFYEGLITLAEDADTVLLEVGPGRTLSTLARQAKLPLDHMLPTLRHPQDAHNDYAFLLQSMGRLWAAGVALDWQQIAQAHGERRRRVSLPGYPFERQRHWLEPKKIGSLIQQPRLGQAAEMHDWFYVPSWHRSAPAPTPRPVDGRHCLVFAETSALSEQLLAALSAHGYLPTVVRRGGEFARHDDRNYTLDPRRAEDYNALIAGLTAAEALPDAIFHLWSIVEPDLAPAYADLAALDEVQDAGFYSLLRLAQALGQQGVSQPLRLITVTNSMQDVAGDTVLLPQRATVLGPAKVIAAEYPFVRSTSVDVTLPTAGERPYLPQQLLAEAQAIASDLVVAYRGRHRWVQGFERVTLDSVLPTDLPLRDGGVYLVTGGLGGVGLTLAERIARTVKATLVLMGRSPLPPRETWDKYLAEHSSTDTTAQRMLGVRAIEAHGGKVITLAADVGDPQQLALTIAQIEVEHGPLSGVVHAAGVAGGGIMQLKTPEAAAAVLEPKVRGALALELAIGTRNLDFFVLCSSIYALVPSLGQVDYCGANNFLDIFAAAYSARTGIRTIAINWGGWDEVGMAARANQQVFAHPLVDALHADHGQRQAYLTMLDTANNWVLNEHVLMGQGAMPGTGYLELVRFLSPRPTAQRLLKIQDVYFVTPLVVEEATRRPMLTIVREEGEERAYTVAARSQLADGRPRWEPHMMGRVTTVPARPAPRFAIADLIARCSAAVVEPAATPPSDGEEHLLIFGPRWQSVRAIYYGEREAVAVLEFPAAFADELRELTLHPALLDAATKFGVGYFGQEAYLPLAYRSVLLHAPLPARLYSYLRCRPDMQAGAEVISFDMFLLDSDGVCVVEIEEFSLKRVADEQALARDADGSVEAAQTQRATALTIEAEEIYTRPRAGQQREEGRISPQEGAETFMRALAQPLVTQVVVSLTDIERTITEALDQSTETEDEAADSAPVQLNPRPMLASPYEEPRTPTERQLAEIWQRVLGIEQISIHDSFMELGGDSVLAIQVMAQAKTRQLSLTPNLIFQHQTIAALAEVLTPDAAPEAPARVDRPAGMPLTPAQICFFSNAPERPSYTSHSLLVEFDQAMEPELLEDAWRHVLANHDIFQHHFIHNSAGWEQRREVKPAFFDFTYVEAFYAAESNQAAIIESCAADLQAQLDLTNGPFIRVALFNRGLAKDLLLLVMHEAVADRLSAALLLDEVHTVYNALIVGEPAPALSATTTLETVVTQLQTAAATMSEGAEAAYWQQLPVERVVGLPRDFAVEPHFNTEASARFVEVDLSFGETHMLIERTNGDEDRLLELCAAALAHSLATWSDSPVQWIAIERHARNALRPLLAQIDPRRTVGPLSTSAPLLVQTPAGATATDALAAVRTAFQAGPAASYELLRYVQTPPALNTRFAAYPQPEVRLSIALDWAELLPTGIHVHNDDFGTPRSPAGRRRHLIDVQGKLHKDRFRLRLVYSEQLHERTTINRLAEQYRHALRQLLS